MKQSFTCKNSKCNKVSVLNGIEQLNGHSYVVCEHCQSKNEITKLPTPDGDPAKFQVTGLLSA